MLAPNMHALHAPSITRSRGCAGTYKISLHMLQHTCLHLKFITKKKHQAAFLYRLAYNVRVNWSPPSR